MTKIPIKPIVISKAFQGRWFKTKECKNFENDFFMLAPKRKMIKGIVEVEYKFYVKNHKRVDYDNFIKVFQDLLVKCEYIEDDRFIYKATIYKIPSDKDYIEFLIKKYDNSIESNS